jgi:hypothetical protein
MIALNMAKKQQVEQLRVLSSQLSILSQEYIVCSILLTFGAFFEVKLTV